MRETNLVWILDPVKKNYGPKTHVNAGRNQTLCGLDLSKHICDDQYGLPECGRCYRMWGMRTKPTEEEEKVA